MSLSVERAAHQTVITGPADLRDQKWLDAQVAVLGDGIEAAHAIWTNWSANRNVGRLHPGQTPGEYIASRGLRPTLAEAMAALPDGSLRQVAAVAGVSHETVRAVKNLTPEPEARVVGGDGKSYPTRVARLARAEFEEAARWIALRMAVVRLEEEMREEPAARVPASQRADMARRIRRLQNDLALLAFALEQPAQPAVPFPSTSATPPDGGQAGPAGPEVLAARID